jgi:hypothetical protein
MNERIKQLVRESNLDVYGLGKERYRWEYTVEKFAELIVQECADIATMNQFQWDSTGSYVLKHFGVEQDVNETLRNRSTYFGNDI